MFAKEHVFSAFVSSVCMVSTVCLIGFATCSIKEAEVAVPVVKKPGDQVEEPEEIGAPVSSESRGDFAWLV